MTDTWQKRKKVVYTSYKRRHPRKSEKFRRKKYFRSLGTRNWIFFAPIKTAEGETIHLDLFEMSRIPILRHTKIKAEAHPFDPRFTSYFKEREEGKRQRPDMRPGKDTPQAEVFNRNARVPGSSNLGLQKI